MKKIIAALLISFGSMSAFAQDIPKEWNKDFVITLGFHGSMSGGSTEARFTYDSCVYTNTPSHADDTKTKFYVMKAEDRVAILKKLRELKADKIETKREVYAVHDGWSQSLCLGGHCIEGGTSVEMDEKNKNRFLDAYRYLEDFAENNAKKKKK
jgi:hypothetical protein